MTPGMPGGAANLGRASLPRESFAELAFELRLIARDRVADAESVESLIASLEVKMESDLASGVIWGTPSFARVRLDGCRDALAELRRRAAFAASAAEWFSLLASREEEVRRLLAPPPPANVTPKRGRSISGLFHFARRPPDV